MSGLFAGPLLQHPQWIPLVAGALAACALLLLAGRLRARRRLAILLGAQRPRPNRGGDLLLLAALAALGVALLGPRLGERRERGAAGGADLVLLLDVSRSMQAPDTPPSRLARAQRLAGGVLARLEPGDRVALAAFAGHGVLLAPLTRDLAALGEMLAFVDAELIGRGGSDLEGGLAAALAAFPPAQSSSRPRSVLVLSDGEDPQKRGPGDAPARAARAGVRVVTAAFGSEEGARIRQGDGWLRDAWGHEVVSKRDGRALARLAEATGGRAFQADRWGELDADALVAELRRGAGRAAGPAEERAVPAVRMAPFAALAVLLLALEAARPRRRRLVAAAAGLTGLAALGDAPPRDAALPEPPPPAALEARLRARPDDAHALFWLGIARARRGDPDEAARAFAAAALHAHEDRLAARALYDLGVVELARGDLEAARDAFFDAVALDPDDLRALYNLEWTLAALEREEPPPDPEAPPPPEPEPEPRPAEPEAQAGPTPTAQAERTGQAPELEPLSQQEVQRWLDAVQDDPRRGLRAAALEARGERPRQPGPAW